MSEPTQHTNVDGDLNGNALSGSFSGPVHVGEKGQTVTVVVQQALQAELPPELRNASLKQVDNGIINALQHLEDRIYHDKKEDRIERKERQEETDQRFAAAEEEADYRYEEAKTDRRRIWHFLVVSLVTALLSLGISLINIWLINQLVERFGWLW